MSPRQSGQTGHSGADPGEGYGPSPLQDELRCPCRDNQGGTASESLPLKPVRDFLFFGGVMEERLLRPEEMHLLKDGMVKLSAP